MLVDRGYEKATELPCRAGVRCLAFSPDSHFLASAGEDMQVSVWDIIAERIVFALPKEQDWISGVAFSPDGAALAFCGFGRAGVSYHPVRVDRVEIEPRDPSYSDDEEGDGEAHRAGPLVLTVSEDCMTASEAAPDASAQPAPAVVAPP